MARHQHEDGSGGSKPQAITKQHNIFPLSAPRAKESSDCTLQTYATLDAMFDPKTTDNSSPNCTQQQAADKMFANLNHEANKDFQTSNLISIINELGELIEDAVRNQSRSRIRTRRIKRPVRTR